MGSAARAISERPMFFAYRGWPLPATAARVIVCSSGASISEGGGDVRQVEAAHRFFHHVAVDAVRAIRERDPGCGVAPAHLHVRTGVPDRAGRVGDAEAAVAHEM